MDDLDRQGFAVVPRAVPPRLLARLVAAADRLFESDRRDGRPLHLLGAIQRDEVFLELLDFPPTFSLVTGALGWNVHMYHSHLDVHPPQRLGTPEPWRWHQDGGRQNVELETDPRPRLSIKVAYFLSDVSEPDRGNMLVLPGSHRTNHLPGREGGRTPPGAIPLFPEPGTAVVFDRR